MSAQGPIVVAVDGPAGSGKSSVSRAAARARGFDFLDTGAAYRALAWLALERGVDVEDQAAVTALLDAFDYEGDTDPDSRTVRVGGVDVTESIREQRVSSAVSAVARVPAVREHVNALFRSILFAPGRAGIIAEGRDITTVVAPDAHVRVLLTADEEVRVARRAAESGTHPAAAVGESLRARDAADSRVNDFMTAADGVTTLDSTHLDFEATVEALLALIPRA